VAPPLASIVGFNAHPTISDLLNYWIAKQYKRQQQQKTILKSYNGWHLNHVVVLGMATRVCPHIRLGRILVSHGLNYLTTHPDCVLLFTFSVTSATDGLGPWWCDLFVTYSMLLLPTPLVAWRCKPSLSSNRRHVKRTWNSVFGVLKLFSVHFWPLNSVWLCGNVGGVTKGQANLRFSYFSGVLEFIWFSIAFLCLVLSCSYILMFVGHYVILRLATFLGFF
jgi:hypothetical protein